MNLKTLALGFLLCLASAAASANGVWTNVTILHIWSYTLYGVNAGTILVQLSANSTGGPACATSKGYTIVDVSTPSGALTAAAAESAFIQGATITVHGNGACGGSAGVTEEAGDIEQ